MIRRTRAAGAGLALLGVVGCSPSMIRDGALDESIAAGVVGELERLRGLSFRREVPMRVQKADALREILIREIHREYSPEELEAIERLYHFVGLLSEDERLLESILDLYAAQIAGFYDPRSETLFLVQSSEPSTGWWVRLLGAVLQRDLVGELFLAHELTHALQDQHTSVLARTTRPGDDDAALAARAVAEGDATLAGFAVVLGGIRGDALPALVRGLQSLPGRLDALGDVPPVIREPLLFQYVNGVDFTARAYQAGGWRAVDSLLEHPPTSTEQILWPDKFYVDRDDPRRITLGGLDPYRKQPAWHAIDENTFGELFVRILVERFLGPNRATWVGLGWDGDRFAAFERAGRIHFFWMSVWDGARDAREFFEAGRTILDRRFGRERTWDEESGGEATVARGNGTVPWRIERQGDQVLVVAGPPEDRIAELAARVWSDTSVAPKGTFRSVPLDLARRAADQPEAVETYSPLLRTIRPSRPSLIK